MKYVAGPVATMRPSVRLAAAVCLAAIVVMGLTLALERLRVFGVDGPITDPVDFRAFYCSAHVLLAGADPYRYGPLRECQSAVLALGGLRSNDYHILFAVLPPAVIALFFPFAALPFPIATELWYVGLLFAVACAVVGASKFVTLPRVAIAASLVASLGLASIVTAQVVPFVLARSVVEQLLWKIPTWCGLALLLAISAARATESWPRHFAFLGRWK